MRKLAGLSGFVLAAVVSFASGTYAQINSPAPPLQDQPSVHAWTVLGVVSNGALSTAVTCTNTLGSSVIVGVEVFDDSGGAALNDASVSSVAVSPGATVRFATSEILAFPADSILLNLPFPLPFVFTGVARVLTTTSAKGSQNILCSAILSEVDNFEPPAMTSLPVIPGK